MVKFATHSDLNPRTHSPWLSGATWPVTGCFMQQRTGFALRAAVAAVTLGVSAIALAPASNAAPEDTCLRAPKGVAPQGKHWYYRTERPAMRKCWYLAEKGLTVTQRAAARTAPQDEPDEEADTPATVASVPAAPAAKVPAASAANVAPAPIATTAPAPVAEPPQPVITTLTTRNVSNPSEITLAAVAPALTQPFAAPNSASDTATAAEAA